MAQAKIVASVLLEAPTEESYGVPNYTDDENKYLTSLQRRLERAKNLRGQPHPEFDDMDFVTYWQKCEDLANTKIKPKVNKQDLQFQTGTLRTKLFAFLSSIQGLNLDADITAFDENDVVMSTLGTAMEDIDAKANELDEDEEKKLLRQYELLKHGYVFVEEIWDDQWVVEKDPVKNYGGEFRGVKIKSREVKKLGHPVRNIISGLSVYLGDLTKYLISEQPYVFTAQTIRYDKAEQIYGHFENWKYVCKKLRPWSGDTDKAMSNNAWRLLDTQDEYVEVIKYSDKPNNEFQIILNGVPMLPLGFPFPWGYSDYNIAQQNLKPIRADFAYGKSFIFENKNPIQFLDELMKLALLKTQKSFLPPYINVSGKVISTRVLMPATISMGIPDGSLKPISDHEITGVTNAEFNMIQKLIETIDKNTASNTFAGAPEKGSVTATQIVELQRQARIMMGVLIVCASLLEKKLKVLRLMNNLKNWFDPIDEVVDQARTKLNEKYRVSSRMTSIEGEGSGMRMVVPTNELPTPEQIKANEQELKKNLGMPVRIVAISPRALDKAKITWQVTVNPKERKSSELSKMLFSAEVEQAIGLGLQVDPQWIQQRFAEVWEENGQKMFAKAEAPQQPVPPAGAGASPMTPQIKRPQIGIGNPSPGAPAVQ